MILDHVASGRFVLECWERRSLVLAIGSKYERCACCVKLLYLQDGRHVNAVIMSFDPNKNYETYESSEIS